MAEINIAGETFNVLIEGDETKPALLLVNGLGTNLHMWDAQVPELLKQFRVVRYDGRGHGESTVSEGPYSIEGLARDAIAILDALGISKAHLIGLSMGGFIGQWILCHAPERIGRAVLANTGALIGNPDLWNSRINKIRESGLPAVADNVVERWFSKDFREAHPKVVAPVADVLKQTSAEGYASACAALRDADLRESVRSIKAKVLVIASTYDVATPPELGEYLAQVIDGAKLIKLETGHLSNVEDPLHFTEAVMEFLTAPETAIPASTPALANVSRRPRPVKRTIGTPVPQPTGSTKVAAKKASTKTASGTPASSAPAPKAIVVPLPANKKALAKAPVASPAPEKLVAKTVASKAPAKTPPVAKAATAKPLAKAAPTRTLVSAAAPAKAPATKATAPTAANPNSVSEKAIPKKITSPSPTGAKTAAKMSPAKPTSAPKQATKTSAAPAPAAKTAPAAKIVHPKKAVAPTPAPKAAAPKTAASKAAATKSAAPVKTPAKAAATKSTAAAKSPAPKTTAAKPAPGKAPAKKVAPVKSAPGKPASRPAR